MQTGFEGCVLFSSIKSCIQKVCAVSLIREALRVSLPLFWTRPSAKNFYKISQNSSFSVASPKDTNYNLLGRHVVDSPYNWESVNGHRHSNLPSSTARVCTEFKDISVDTHTENRVLRDDSRFINHDTLSTKEESLNSEAVSGTSLENTSVDFRINKTNRLINLLSSTIQAVLPAQINFRYLQQQQIQALKTQGSYCKNVILNRNSKEELQWWIKNLKICNGCYLIQSHSQGLIQTDASRMGWGAVCQGYHRGAMVKGGTFITLKCIRTESRNSCPTYCMYKMKKFTVKLGYEYSTIGCHRSAISVVHNYVAGEASWSTPRNLCSSKWDF